MQVGKLVTQHSRLVLIFPAFDSHDNSATGGSTLNTMLMGTDDSKPGMSRTPSC